MGNRHNIGDYAFEACSSLTSVTIGNSVTSIGEDAFWYCSSLEYNVYDNAKYLGNENNPYVALIDASSTDITSCTIHNDTKIIYSSAFWECSSLTSVTIPDSVTSIGRYAFYGCSSLTSVVIGDSVTSIGDWAFSNCDNLERIVYTGTYEQWQKVDIGWGFYYDVICNDYDPTDSSCSSSDSSSYWDDSSSGVRESSHEDSSSC